MSTDPRTLLQLMWLASPALPVGGFSYSEGLEAAVEAGRVRDEGSAASWLQDQLALTLVRSEWSAVAHAHAAFEHRDEHAVQVVNDWVLHTRESRELRLQTEQMGRSLADWLAQRHGGDARVPWLRALSPAPTWPVAYALAGVVIKAGLNDLLMAHGFAWAENMVQAAIKCIPLGQSAGQRVLHTLADALAGLAPTVPSMPVDFTKANMAAQAYAPGLAIFSARHEQQYSRLFRS